MGWDHRLERWQVGHRAELLDHAFKWLTHVGTSGVVWLGIAIAVHRRRPAIAVAAAAAATTVEPTEAVAPATEAVVGFSQPATDEVSSPQEVLRESEPVAQGVAPQETPPAPSD